MKLFSTLPRSGLRTRTTTRRPVSLTTFAALIILLPAIASGGDPAHPWLVLPPGEDPDRLAVSFEISDECPITEQNIASRIGVAFSRQRLSRNEAWAPPLELVVTVTCLEVPGSAGRLFFGHIGVKFRLYAVPLEHAQSLILNGVQIVISHSEYEYGYFLTNQFVLFKGAQKFDIKEDVTTQVEKALSLFVQANLPEPAK